MCASESQRVELFTSEPDSVEFGTLPHWLVRPSELCAKRIKCDSVAGDGVFDGAERRGVFREAKRCECLESRLQAVGAANICGPPEGDTPNGGGVNLDIREFPKVGVHNSGGPLSYEEFAVAFHDKGNEVALSRCGALAKVWKFTLSVFAIRNAEFSDRADSAIRRTWCADNCAEFH